MGIVGLLSVAFYRHQRLADETTDLRRNIAQQETRIKDLQSRLEDCDTVETATPYDSSWRVTPAADSVILVHQVSWPMQ